MDFLIVCDEIHERQRASTSIPFLTECECECACVSAKNGKHVQFCSIGAAKNVMLTTLLTHISSSDDFQLLMRCIKLLLVHHHRHHHRYYYYYHARNKVDNFS